MKHEICERCESSKDSNTQTGMKILICDESQFKGKWVVEIEKCPKEED